MEENANGRPQSFASEYFLRRLLAYAADMALCYGLFYLMGKAAPDGELFTSPRSDLTRNVLFSLYMFLTHLTGGRSPGKRLAGLRVTALDGSPPGFFRLLYREFLGRTAIEKCNLLLLALPGASSLLEKARAGIANPLADTLFTALVSLPWLTFASFAFAFARPDGRALHDLVSGTRVERAAKGDLPAKAGKDNDKRRPMI